MKLTKRDLLLLVILIYFTFIGGTFYSQINFYLRVANQLLVTGLLAGWLWLKLRRGEGLPRTTLDAALALYLVANVVSAGFGLSPRFSGEMLWTSVVHLLAFYWLVDLLRRGWSAKLAWAFYTTSAVVCVLGLTEWLAWYLGAPVFGPFAQGWLEIGGWRHPIPPQFYRLNITLNGSTPLAAYLALLIPPAIALILTLPRRSENRTALIIWLGLALLVQILTFSRAGVLALLVSLPLTALGYVASRPGRPLSRLASWQRLGSGRRLGLALAGIFLALVGLVWLPGSFAGRVASTNHRFMLWGAALEVFQANWLLGAGPANFGRALLRLNDPTLPRYQIASAHSVYLNTAAELGLVGLLAGAMLYLAVVRSWRQRWQQTTAPADRFRLAACGAALAGYAAQTMVDTYAATPNILLLAAVVAFIVAELRSAAQPRRQLAGAGLALLVIAGYLAGLGWIARADLSERRSFRAEAAGDLSAARAAAEQAYQLDPGLTGRLFRLALLEARLAAQAADPALLRSAAAHYRAGLAQEPIKGLNSANLAGVLWAQGARLEALQTLQQTIAVEPNPLYLVNLGYFCEQQDWPLALAAYGQALFRNPALAASGFWQATPERAARWPALVEAAVAQIDPPLAASPQLLRLQLGLARPDDGLVEAQLPALADFGPAEASKVPLAGLYLARQQVDQAAKLLEPGPQSGEEYHLLGRLKLAQNELEAAERLLKTAAFLQTPAAYTDLGRLYEQQGRVEAAMAAYQRGFTPHATAENIELTIYGRFGGNDLAPQLLRIGVGPDQVRAWLALARLYEQQHQFDQAKQIYTILLAEDPFLNVAQERLDQLLARAPFLR
jgi:tetratricopeptide (TPR) repeat protein